MAEVPEVAQQQDQQIITVQSADGVRFPVPRDVIRLFKPIETMIQDLQSVSEPEEVNREDNIPTLQTVNANVLTKVIDWCKQHKNDPEPTEDEETKEKEKRTDDIPEWDKEFLKVDQKMLFDIIQAANYLDIKGLLDVSCKTVANIMKGKTPEEIRKIFNLPDDIPESEKEEMRRKNPWLEE